MATRSQQTKTYKFPGLRNNTGKEQNQSTPTIPYQIVTPTNGQMVFNLTVTPSSTESVIMFVHTHKQVPNVDYSVTGNVLTYTNTSYTIRTTDIVEFYYI